MMPIRVVGNVAFVPCAGGCGWRTCRRYYRWWLCRRCYRHRRRWRIEQERIGKEKA